MPIKKTYLLVLIGIIGCNGNRSTDNRSDIFSSEDLAASLATPILSISLQKNSNTLEWQSIEGADHYDLYYLEVEQDDFALAEKQLNIVSPLVFEKPDQKNRKFYVVAKGNDDKIFSEPSKPVDDLPVGDLAICLSYEGESLITLNSILEFTDLTDCYSLIPSLTQILDIDISNQSLTNLSPLEMFTNLEALNLSQNGFTDLKSLKDMKKLKSLSLNDNSNLASLAELSPLEQLEQLSFSNTSVADLVPIKNFIELKVLLMENTAVSSLAPVAQLSKLESASFTGTVVVKQEDLCPTVSVMKDLARFCLAGVTITYGQQVKRLLDLHCVSCHNANVPERSILDNEVDVVNAAAQINARISDGTMPPNGALSDTDKAIIASWYASTVLNN